MGWGYKIKCLQCGEGFVSQRINAEFCKTSCRVAFHNAEKVRKAWNAALDKILGMAGVPAAVKAKIKRQRKPDPRAAKKRPRPEFTSQA